MCEQHHIQTDHHDGLADWATHAQPAGVPSDAHVHVPANFAWLRVCSDDADHARGSKADEKDLQLPVATELAPSTSAVTPKSMSAKDSSSERGVPVAPYSMSSVSPHDNVTGDDSICQDAKSASATERMQALRSETRECLAELESCSIASERAASVVDRSCESSAPPSPVSLRFTRSESFQAQGSNTVAPHAYERARSTTDRALIDHRSLSRDVDARQRQRAERSHSDTHSSLRLPPASSTHHERRASSASSSTKQPRSSASDRFVLLRSRLQTGVRGYRTAYSDANAWRHVPKSPWTAQKQQQMSTADAAGAATRYEPRPIVSAADALCIAQAAAREFLGTSLHVKLARPGSPGRLASDKARVDAPDTTSVPKEHVPSAAPTGRQVLEPPVMTRAHATRDEAIQTDDISELDAVYQQLDDKQPSHIATAAALSVKDPSVPVASGAARQRTRSSPKAPLPRNRAALPQQQQSDARSLTPSSSTSVRSTKAKVLASTPSSLSTSTRSSSMSKRLSRPPSAQSNPVLLHPRFPPEPLRFRAKSTYMTEFGHARVR